METKEIKEKTWLERFYEDKKKYGDRIMRQRAIKSLTHK